MKHHEPPLEHRKLQWFPPTSIIQQNIRCRGRNNVRSSVMTERFSWMTCQNIFNLYAWPVIFMFHYKQNYLFIMLSRTQHTHNNTSQLKLKCLMFNVFMIYRFFSALPHVLLYRQHTLVGVFPLLSSNVYYERTDMPWHAPAFHCCVVMYN